MIKKRVLLALLLGISPSLTPAHDSVAARRNMLHIYARYGIVHL